MLKALLILGCIETVVSSSSKICVFLLNLYLKASHAYGFFLFCFAFLFENLFLPKPLMLGTEAEGGRRGAESLLHGAAVGRSEVGD